MDAHAGTANQAERRRWNDDYWTSIWPCRERLTGTVTEVLLGHLRPQAGERVVDIGTGGGTAALAAAPLVGPDGAVVGADLSHRLVELARQRADLQGDTNLRFTVCDMQVERLDEAPFTVAMSQFGVMFFDEPQVAFANIAAQVEPGGRLGFACWQSAADNPWHPSHAVAAYLPTPAPTAPGRRGPGPFSLADGDQTTHLLSEAGWAEVDRTPYRTTVTVSADAIADRDQPAHMGVPEDQLVAAGEALARHLAQFDLGGGAYEVPLAYQIFTASKPP